MVSYKRPLIDLVGEVVDNGETPPYINSGIILAEIATGAPSTGHTGIVLPRGLNTHGAIDVILYFHGTHANAIKDYLQQRKFKEIIEATGKTAVLAAPQLGYESEFGNLGSGNALTSYVDKVLQCLTDYGPYASKPQLRYLILAAHSGGGRGMIAAAKALTGVNSITQPEAWGFDCLYGKDTPVAAPEPLRVAEVGHPSAKTLTEWEQRVIGKSLESDWQKWANGNHVFRHYWGAGGTKTRTANLDLLDQRDPSGLGIILQPRFYAMDNAGVIGRVSPEPGPVAAHDDVPQTALGPAIKSCPWLD